MNCLSWSCSVTTTLTEKGRSVVSCQNIPQGEIIISNVPTAHQLLSQYESERCSFCCTRGETQEGKQGSNQQPLMKCSRCNRRYCDRDCQKNDWKCHKLECKSHSKLSRQDPFIRHETNLLLRFLAACENIENDCRLLDSSTARCGSSHLECLSSSDSPYPGLQETVQTSFSISNQPKSKIEHTLQQFRCNNFGLMDELLVCIGAGVFPAVALLNHSCRPNCILRCVLVRGKAPLLQVIAARDISCGEELTHSYVDLVESTQIRQSKLQSIYHFTCDCSRCYSTHSDHNGQLFNLPRVFRTTGKYLDLLHSTDDDSHSSEVFSNVETLLAESHDDEGKNGSDLWRRINMLTFQANRAVDVRTEIQYLSEAINILKPHLGVFHIELYRLRAQLFTAHLMEGNISEALDLCQYLVGFLYVVLQDVPNHPLLGLQLFTLGDLMTQSSTSIDFRDTLRVYEKARQILLVAYGVDHDYISRLEDSIIRTMQNK